MGRGLILIYIITYFTCVITHDKLLYITNWSHISIEESDILKASSRSVFGGLEYGQNRILLHLAKEGPLNLKELGVRTSKGRTITGFDRWGVKIRLEGSSNFVGLINHDFVEKIAINKKETKYRLTLKGFLASLGHLEFDNVYLVRSYKELLCEYTNNTKKTKLIMNSIKDESKYLLFSFYLQGINWLRSRYLSKFIAESRFNGEKDFPFTGISRNFHSEDDFAYYENVFDVCIKSYELAQDGYSYVLPQDGFREYINKLKNKKFNPQMRESIALFLYHRWWIRYLPNPIQFDDRQLVSEYLIMQKHSIRKDLMHLTEDEMKSYVKNKLDPALL